MIINVSQTEVIRYTARCPARNLNGRMCSQPAGSRTNHKGFGKCAWHTGATSRIERIWKEAMAAAEELDITPHEALLGFVRQAAGRSAYVDLIIRAKLDEHVAAGGDVLNPPTELDKWFKESRLERNLAARTAKAAVDAGVMVALERRLDLEGSLVADATLAALDVLDLTPEQRMAALGAAQSKLLAIDSGNDAPSGG